MFSNFGGGGNSNTMTQAGESRPESEERKQSDFKAFAGSGVSLGSDLENTASRSWFGGAPTVEP